MVGLNLVHREQAYQELFLLFLRRLVIEATGLNDFIIDVQLVPSARVHCFLHALLSDETQDADSFGLANTMGTVLSLKIGMRIPGRILDFGE